MSLKLAPTLMLSSSFSSRLPTARNSGSEAVGASSTCAQPSLAKQGSSSDISCAYTRSVPPFVFFAFAFARIQQ
jgi:hypothetical protein